MHGHQCTPAKYVLETIVESFGNLLFSFPEHHSTHTYAVVARFCQLENIDYLLLRYRNTGTLPFEKCCEEWLFDGEA
jgi:hypothetical protein